MVLNTCELRSNCIKTASFPKKLPSSWGLRPQTPVSDEFELHYSLLNTFPNLHICTFVFGFSSIPIAKFGLGAEHRPLLLIFQSTISLSNTKFVSLSKIFDDVIASDLWFAPPPPNQKSLLRL